MMLRLNGVHLLALPLALLLLSPKASAQTRVEVACVILQRAARRIVILDSANMLVPVLQPNNSPLCTSLRHSLSLSGNASSVTEPCIAANSVTHMPQLQRPSGTRLAASPIQRRLSQCCCALPSYNRRIRCAFFASSKRFV